MIADDVQDPEVHEERQLYVELLQLMLLNHILWDAFPLLKKNKLVMLMNLTNNNVIVSMNLIFIFSLIYN